MRRIRTVIVALGAVWMGCTKGEPAASSTAAKGSAVAPKPVPADAMPPDAPADAPRSAADEPPPSGPPTPPVGSPKFCGKDDRTHVPLARSTFVSALDPKDARDHLEGQNEICGDTWCEGSFEWFFYDLRSTAKRSEVTMRTYANLVSPKGGTARDVVVRGDRFVGRVLQEKVVSSCTTACGGFAKPPTWKPCLVLDLRCELLTPWSKDGGTRWSDDFIACGIALESAIRKIHPEFAPSGADD